MCVCICTRTHLISRLYIISYVAQFGALDRSHLQKVEHFIFDLFMSWISDSNTAEVETGVGWSLNLMNLQDVQRYCILHEKRTKSSLVISYGTDGEDRILEKTTEALLRIFTKKVVFYSDEDESELYSSLPKHSAEVC